MLIKLIIKYLLYIKNIYIILFNIYLSDTIELLIELFVFVK